LNLNHCLNSFIIPSFDLELGYVTAEKIAPSPIDLVALLQQAVEAERKSARNGSKAPLKDVLGRCIAEYNRMVSVKRHRIDSSRRSLVYNLLLDYLYLDFESLFL